MSLFFPVFLNVTLKNGCISTKKKVWVRESDSSVECRKNWNFACIYGERKKLFYARTTHTTHMRPFIFHLYDGTVSNVVEKSCFIVIIMCFLFLLLKSGIISITIQCVLYCINWMLNKETKKNQHIFAQTKRRKKNKHCATIIKKTKAGNQINHWLSLEECKILWQRTAFPAPRTISGKSSTIESQCN